jgi:tetratricopeptide (TPR) repeat protein
MDDRIRSHLETLEAAPGDVEAFRALEGIYREGGRFEELIALYEARARLLAPSEASPLFAQAAALARTELRSVARAEELYRAQLTVEPDSQAALAALAALAEEREDWPALAAVLERASLVAHSPPEGAQLALRLGRIFEEKLGRRDRAALHYGRAARLAPDLAEARRRALDSCLALRRFAQAKRMLDGAREAGAERGPLAASYAQLGAALAGEALFHDVAMDALIEAQALDRGTPGAAEARERLTGLPRRWRDEAAALEVRVGQAARPEAAELLLLVAQLYGAYDPDGAPKAVERLERAWALVPGHPAVLELLDRILSERRDYGAQAAALERLAAATKDRGAQVQVYLAQAQLRLVRLADSPGALAALQQALEADPACEPAALQAFERRVDAGQLAEALDGLEKHLAAAPGKPGHAPLRVRAAEIAAGRLNDPERARRHLEAALRADPGHLPAAAALTPLLAESGEWEPLAEILALRAAAEPEAAERAKLLERLGTIELKELDRPREAFRTLSRALTQDPRRSSTRLALEEAARRSEKLPELCRALRAAAQAADEDGVARKALLRRVAEVLDQEIGHPDEAAAAWRAVVVQDPLDREATAALSSCEEKARGHVAEASRLEAAYAAATGSDRRAPGEALARLTMEMDRPDRTAAIWRELLAAAPGDVKALWGLHAALEAVGGPRATEERAQVLSRLAALTAVPAERAELELERATLLSDALARPGEAAGAAVAVLTTGGLTVPQQQRAVALLERLLARGMDPLRIARVLAPVHAARGEPEKQVAMLEFMARRLPNGAEPRERARHLLDASSIRAERLGDARGALTDAGEALRACPDHAEARRRCEQLAREVGALGELFSLLVEAARRLEGRPEDEILLRRRAAMVAEEELGSSDDAAGQLRRCLALRPGDPELMAALTRVALAGERWEEAAGLLQERARGASGPERVALLGQLADVLSERLQDPLGAAEVYREALQLAEPEQRPRLLARLAAALGGAGDARGQADALAELAAATATADPAEAARLSRQSARLAAGQGDQAGAVRQLAAAVQASPHDEAAVQSLEEALADGPPEVALVAGRALAPVYAMRGDVRGRVRAMAAQARHHPEASGRAEAWREVARAQELELNAPAEALAAAVEVVRASPADAEARRELRRLAEAAQEPEAATRVLEEVALELSSEERLPVVRELADWFDRKLEARDRAAAAWERVRQLAPDDPAALAALRRLQRGAEHWPELVEVCQALARLAGSPAARQDPLREIAVVAESRLDDLPRAAAAWREVTLLAPEDPEAAAALERLLTRLDRPEELAGVLQERLGRGFDAEAAWRLGELRRTRLGDPGGALELLAEVARRDPGHAGARAALVALATQPGAVGREALAAADAVLRAAGDHRPRLEARRARLAVVEDPAERTRLHAELRGILERDLDDAPAALAAARQAFEADEPGRAEAESELRRLAEGTGQLHQLAEAYQAVAAGSGADAPAWLRRAARVCGTELRDGQAAIEAWRRVLAVAPDDGEALESLEKLYAEAQAGRERLEMALRRSAVATGEARVPALCHASEIALLVGDLQAEVGALLEARGIVPRDAEVLAALEQALGRAGRAREQAEVLGALADVVGEGDPAGRLALLLRRAGLLEHDPDPRRPVEAYAGILAERPREPGAVAGLERLLQRPDARPLAEQILEDVHRLGGDPARLAGLLELRLEGAAPGPRATLLAEIASLRERSGDPAAAFAARRRAFEASLEAGQDDPVGRAELERLAGEAGAWAELAQVFEAAVPKLPRAAADLARRLAALHADRLGDLDRAASWWDAVAAAAPGPEPLAGLVRVRRRQGAKRELAVALERLADATSTNRSRKELLFEVAKIMDEQLADREGALAAYRKILAIDPEDPNALKLLGRLLGAAERWEELVVVLEREAAAAEGRPEYAAEAAELRFRLGRIRQTRLSDAPGALAAYRSVLARSPRHPGALSALEEVARGSGPVAVQAALVLEPIYAAAGEHAKVVEVLEARIPNEPDPAARAALLRQVAERYAGGVRNPELAFVAAGRALAADPDSGESLALAVRLGTQAGHVEELAGLLAEHLDGSHVPAVRAEYLRQLARLEQDPAKAARVWQALLEVTPEDREASAGLLFALRGGSDPEGLEKALRRALALEDRVEERTRLLADLATLQEERLNDGPGAMVTLKRLLELAPLNREALARLDRLCVAGERWVELGDVLSREALAAQATGDASALLDLRQRLGELKDGRLHDRDGALALFEEVLAVRPDHPEALARLEAMLSRDPSNARAAQALEAAYAATGNHARQAAALETRASERPDPQERKALYVELADLREHKLQEPEMAFLALCKAFREDPADREVRQRLEHLAARADHHEELSALYQDELERLPPGPMAEVAVVLGRLHEGPLGDPAPATAFFRRALALEPRAAPVALPALDRLYQRLESWPELAEVLQAEADASTGAERVQFLFRLGRLCEERLGAPDRAAEAYERALAADGRHLPSLQALETLYEAAGRKEELHLNLTSQRAVALDAAGKERLLAKQAALSSELGRPEEAIGLWRELLSIRPRHEQALASLEELLEAGQRWSELAAHLRVRLSSSVDRREVSRLNDKLGWVMGAKLGDRSQAIQSYKAVLDSDPRNRKALEALRDIYAAQGDVEALAGAYRRLVPLQEDATGVKQVRLELAEVLLRAGQKSEAVEQAKRAFDIEPHTAGELVRIEGIFGAAGAGGEGVRAAEARAALLAAQGGPAEAVPAWLAVAELWRGQRRPDAAAAALEKVLELDPANRPAYQQLRELHAAGNHWRDFARVCDLFAPNVADAAEKLAILKEVAGVHEKRLGQKEMSFLAWCRALADAPGDLEALGEAERLAHETQADEELAAVLEQVAEEARGMVRARLLLRLGVLRDGLLDDAEGAEAAFRRALEADPASPEALDALTGLFKKRGRVRDLVITLEQKLEAAAGLDEKKALLLELSRLYDSELKDVDEAISAVRRILELDGGDPQAIAALAALYRREHRWGELAGVLARARDLASDDTARIGWQLQIAALYENEIGDDEAAVEGYRTVLGLDDQHQEALAGLERLYTKLDRFAELNRVYERQVQLSHDPVEQVRILAKSAGIFEEKMQDQARAVTQNEAILGLDGANQGAIKALTRLYREQGQFDKLIIVLEHHLSLVTDRKEQVALMVAIGEVWWKEMSRVDRAEQIFNQALQLEPESRQAVSALGRLYERSGNWNLALDMLRREARLSGAGRDAVELYVRLGAINGDMLLDQAAAKEAYEKALALDPGCLPAVRAMKAIHEREKNRDGFLEMLVSEARYAEDDQKKAELFTEVGRILQDEREDREGAARAYEEALKRQPAHLPSARPLSDIYVASQRWGEAERVLDTMVRTLSGGGDAKELCRQCYRQGYVAEKLGNREKALQAYRRAYELDATYLPALEGLGNLLVAEGQLEEALKIFTAIIIHHRDGLTDLEVVETHWQIGEIADRLEQPDRAVGSFKKALEIDQGHEPSRRSLIRLLEAAGDHEGAVEQRQRLLPALEGRARFDMFVAIGKACREQLQDPYQAIDAYLGASRIDPTDLPVTEALLGLYRETRQGQKAADVLAQIISRPEVQADPPRAAKLHLLLAEILRDEVKDEAASLAQFEKALDMNPRLPQAFAAIEEAHTKARRWQALEQAYVRMVQRLPKTPDAAQARLALWRTLGELYRSVLKDDEGARTAYQVVSQADPEDAVSVEICADLAARMPGHEEEAIQAYRQLVRLGAKSQKALSALVGLHAARREYDRAYGAAQVLAHLVGGASPEELAVVSRLRKYARDQANRPLDDKLWALLLHDRVKGPLAEIMKLLGEHAGAMFTQTPKELGINVKKEEIDVGASMLFFVNMFKYVERTLAVEPVRLFRREEEAPRLQLVPTDPPGVVASADAFRDRPKKELWFSIGKALTFKRPELFLARLMPHDQLDLVFQAACSVGTSRFVVTADPHLVAKLKRELERVLPEKVRANTLKLLARKYTEVQHPGDVRAYLDGAELTSNRVGALLAADLEIVRRAVLVERAQVSKLRDETKLRDLSIFCVSEEYAALREQLGLAAVVSA